MGALLARLRKLEDSQSSQAARMIVMRATGRPADGDVNRVLAQHKLVATKADDLVVFITRYENGDGTIEPTRGLPQLVAVHDLTRASARRF